MAQPARWAHLAANDEQTLLEVAGVPGDVGDATLNALTHLPLRTEAWDRVRFLFRERLASTGESERQHFLRGVQRWIPDLDSGSAIVDKQELHGQEGPARTVRRDPDIAWIQSRAPGFLFIDADARAAAVAAVSPDLQAVVVG